MSKSNLVPQAHKLTVAEQSAGGKASGKARAERKTIAETLRKVLDETLPGDPSKTRREAIVEAIAGRTFKGGKAADLKILAEVLGEQVERVKHEGLPTPVVVNNQETAAHLENLKQRKK